MNKFNDKQLKIINNIDGIFVVDAGAGTGKTTTIINRYLKILEKENSEDILLVTFTKNAASDMKEKVLELSKETKSEYNIMTFHSYCNSILKENSLKVSTILEIDDFLLNYELIDNASVEENLFYDFVNGQKKNMNNDYLELLDSVDLVDILYLIKKLASQGIIPKKNGWFLGKELNGSKEDFIRILSKKNEQDNPKKQSKMRSELVSLRRNTYNFSIDELLEDKKVKEDKIVELFDIRNKKLNSFVHYIYREYIKYLVSNNLLNFDFLMVFTFILLYENKEIRDKNKFNYIIIDEFQDTNELQFIISLLLLKKKNLMVVGDWKQSIYAFRNANVENIIKFKDKIEILSRQINKKLIRSPLIRSTDVHSLILDQNYRSSREILELAHHVIKNHNLDNYNLVELKDSKSYNSKIEAYELKDLDNEYRKIVNIVIDLVNNKRLDSLDRNINFSDICILTRTKNNAREIQKILIENNIPSIFEGGANIYRSDLSILLLNYLKLLHNNKDKNALVAILEYENKNLEEIKKQLKLPISIDLISEIHQLKTSSLNKIVSFLIKKYKIDDIYSNTFLINIINKDMDTFDLIKYIEGNIKREENCSLIMHNNERVTIQTIHGSKGLEYPVVIISNINQRIFPSPNMSSGSISYDSILGTRLKKEIVKKPYYYIYDNPITKILKKVVNVDLKEEELRLFYVAITRAKEYLYFTTSNSSEFFKYIEEKIKPEIVAENIELNKLEFEDKNKGKLKSNLFELKNLVNSKSTHEEIGLNKYTYMSSLIGNLFHEFSDLYIKSRGNIVGKLKNVYDKLIDLSIDNKVIIDNYIKFISEYNFENLESEKKIVLKKEDGFVNGIIDIYNENNDYIEIIDLKSDKTIKNRNNYKKQLDVYKNSVDVLNNNSKSKKKEIKIIIYWMRLNKKDLL